jgi:hypothetical protein
MQDAKLDADASQIEDPAADSRGADAWQASYTVSR